MLFKRPKNMTDQELDAREALLERKLENTGKVVEALKMGNALIIMAGVAVLLPFVGATLVHLLAGMGIGVIAMASVRATAEQASRSLQDKREKELGRIGKEKNARVAAALQQAQQAEIDRQRRAEQAVRDAERAQEQKKSLVQSIEQDFNGGVAKPVSVGSALVLKKQGQSPAAPTA